MIDPNDFRAAVEKAILEKESSYRITSYDIHDDWAQFKGRSISGKSNTSGQIKVEGDKIKGYGPGGYGLAIAQLTTKYLEEGLS